MYSLGDYLLINAQGEIEAVSGNTDFWDGPVETWPNVSEFGAFVIARVISEGPDYADDSYAVSLMTYYQRATQHRSKQDET